jgi:hypothetical protein
VSNIFAIRDPAGNRLKVIIKDGSSPRYLIVGPKLPDLAFKYLLQSRAPSLDGQSGAIEWDEKGQCWTIVQAPSSHSPLYFVYTEREIQITEFITLANLMAARADSWAPEESASADSNAVIARFLERLSFRKDGESFRRLWLSLMLCSAVDNFHTYFSEMLQAVFIARPETLKSSEKVEVREVLDYTSMDEFIEASAERKVYSLTSRGFSHLRDYFVDRLGVRPSLADEALSGATEAIGVRNLFVHHRGRVTRQFLRQTSRTDISLGSSITLDRDQVGNLCHALQAVVEAFDEALVSHFGLSVFEPDRS